MPSPSALCEPLRELGTPRATCSQPGPFAEEETHPVDLSSLSSKLLPGFTTLGFKDERRGKGECGVGR